MKTFKLLTNDKVSTVQVIKEVISVSPQGMTLDQMRIRLRILDLVEKEEKSTSLSLEDADYVLLCGVLNATPWQRADRFLLEILDEILSPKGVV